MIDPLINNCVLAADLGGTNLRMAIVASSGEIICRNTSQTPLSRSRNDIIGAICKNAREILSRTMRGALPSSFGLAAAALVDNENGSVFSSPNLPSLDGCDLAAEISKELGLTVTLENDANAAAIGESWLGASVGCQNSICITIGTGVGGGIILGGQPLRGTDGTAGEIGHICVEPMGVLCGCGSFGCLEQYASATAVTRMFKELTSESDKGLADKNPHISSRSIYDAAITGNEAAMEVFRRVGYYLGIAAADLINILNPEMIVITGGASAAWDQFIGPLRAEIQKRAFLQPAERVRIVRAKLGDDAGILGAAFLALDKMTNYVSH